MAETEIIRKIQCVEKSCITRELYKVVSFDGFIC